MAKNDLKDIIDTILAEAVGEGKKGMQMVGETILNRSNKRNISPGQVVRQKSQYTGYSSPGAAAVAAQKNPALRAIAEQAWEAAKGPDDPTKGADFYFNPRIVTPNWASSMTPTVTQGNHAFYRDGPPIPQAPSAPTPEMQSNDMRLMRNPAMSPSAQRSTTDSIVNNSFSPAPSALQAALDARVQRVAPEPAGIDEMMLARTGVGGSRIAAPIAPAGITASDRTRGNINLGVGLPQKMGGANSVESMYAGIIPNPVSPIPASADERLMARMSPSTPQPRAIIPSSTIERGTPRIASTPLPNIGTSQIERGPVTPQTSYPAGNPFVDAATAARQVADNRLAPSEALPPALYGYSAQVAPSAPLPMPTVQRRAPVAANPVQSLASVAPIAPVPVTRAPMGGGVDQLVPQDTSLGPVNNWIGQANPVPNSLAIATGAPSPQARIQRQGSILPGVRLPGVLGMAQGLSQGINNASGTFGNNLDNFIQQGMRRGSNVGVPVGQAGGYQYALTPNGGYVNIGRDPTWQGSSFSTGKATAADKFKEQQNRSSSGASAYSISG